MQPYHTELGGGHVQSGDVPALARPGAVADAYVEPCIRPTDGRYGENPFRFQHYYQAQVCSSRRPRTSSTSTSARCEAIGIDTKRHDVRLVEDDWEEPTIGAWGLGWEVWCDGMEITQFTYFQQVGGIDLDLDPGGDHVRTRAAGDVHAGKAESRWRSSGRRGSRVATFTARASASGRPTTTRKRRWTCSLRRFGEHEDECAHCSSGAAAARLRPGAQGSHAFNLLDARGALSATERAAYIGRVRNLARKVARLCLEMLDAEPAA